MDVLAIEKYISAEMKENNSSGIVTRNPFQHIALPPNLDVPHFISPIIQSITVSLGSLASLFICRDSLTHMEQSNETTLTQPTTQQTLNTVFLEQRKPLNESSLVTGIQHVDPSSKLSLSDPVSLATTHLFQKPILVRQVQWQTDAARDAQLLSFRIPDILTEIQSPALGLLSIHALYRTGFLIRIQVNSSPFHSGRLIAYFNPYGLSGLADGGLNYVSKTGLPHVFIDAANATVGHLEIPFLTLKDYFTTYQSDSDCRIGTFSLDVFNQLAVGTGGSPAVSVSIWLEPIATELAVPVARHDVQLQMESLLSIAEGPIKQLLSMGINGTADLLNGALGTTSRGSGKGRDRPEIPAPENMGLCYSVPNISNGTGANPSDRLALIPTLTEVDDSDTSRMTVGDEMDLKLIAKTPMLLGVKAWTDSLTPGTRLTTIPVHPMVTSRNAAGGIVFALTTYLAYICNAFKFWRGSIRYRFEVVATQHHTGRLIVAWIPNDRSTVNGYPVADTLTINSLTQYPCEIFDLALNKEFEFVVPYNSPSRYKKMPEFVHFDNLPDQVGTLAQDYTLGNLVVMIQNSLTHPGTVANSVDVNIFVSGGDDFDFRSVCPQNNSARTTISFQSGDVELEGTRSGETNGSDAKIGVSTTGVQEDNTQGPGQETHLKFLLSRYYPSSSMRQTIPAGNAVTTSISSTPVFTYPNYTDAGCTSDLLSYFSRLYRFWAGGINHMLIHSTTVNQPVYLYTNHNPDWDYDVPITTTTGLVHDMFQSASQSYPQLV
uniref:Structural polyprotein n=1 Tax=Robinvale bee virus 5 TaxID=2201316 RepID=A0A2U8JQA5_9VIRU|nr:structural polyprotein [Robinvale bee virus 5]